MYGRDNSRLFYRVKRSMKMTIKTQRLTLEPLGVKRLQSTHRYAADPELTRLMVFLPVRDIAETERYLRRCESEMAKERPEFMEFAVMLGNEHIGSVSVYLEENGTAWELGWIIAREFHGKGYAMEAARGLMEYCRANGLGRFIAHCDSENSASRRVMEKLGMSLRGISHGRKNRSSDELRDECLYEVTL